MGEKVALTAKRVRFCQEYVIDHNATQAAIRAGYSEHTSGSIGSFLLQIVGVKEQIAIYELEISAKLGLTAENVLRQLAYAVNFDPRKMYRPDGSLKDVTEMDDCTAMALAGIEVTEIADDEGDITRTKKLKWVDKNQAITLGMRHFGLLHDKAELTGANGAPLVPPTDPVETARQIAFLLAQAVHKGA